MRCTFFFSASFVALTSACGSPPPPVAIAPAPGPRCEAADAGAAVATPHEPSLEAIKDQVIARINAGDAPGLYTLFSSSMKGTFPPAILAQLVEGVRSSKGTITAAPRVRDDGDPRSGVFGAKAERGDWRLELHIDDAGQVVGLHLTEPPPPEPAVKDSTIPLALPVRGKWLVAWASDAVDHNPHTNKEQRRAADLVVVGEGGKHFKADGKKNEDFYAYGKDALAMADGTVVTVVDGVPENAPGAVDTFFSPGNMVIVEHPGSLFAVYAHLQPGKMRVKVGTKVKQGAVLGAVGDSGNTNEPHLHVHLQDAAGLEAAWGVNAVFANVAVTRGGQATKVEKYSFKKDDALDVPTK
jgi:Peptidase family M23